MLRTLKRAERARLEVKESLLETVSMVTSFVHFRWIQAVGHEMDEAAACESLILADE